MLGDQATAISGGLVTTSGMTFALVSGQTYQFEFNVAYDSINSSAGLKLGLTFPAATMIASRVYIPSGTGADAIGQIAASGDSVTATGNGPVNTPALAYVFGTIVAGASGNLALQHACELATSGGPRIRAGTNGFLYQIS